MAVNEGKKSIRGREYYVVQMPADKAILIQLQLTKILGGALGKLAPALSTSSKADGPERMAAMVGAVGALFEKASEEEIQALIFRVVSTAKVDGKRIDINEHFQGEFLADLYPVFFWVLGVNFASFFGAGGLDGVVAKFKMLFLQEMAKAAANAQPSTPPQA